jgi:branched-chain amino acid transport system permease protein
MTWINLVIQGILLGGLYALFASGLSLIFGVMRLVNLAHGDLSNVAAFLALLVVDGLGWNPFLSLVIVLPVMFGIGYLLQRYVLNRTLERGPMPPLLVTFGLAVVIQNVLLEAFSADSQGLDAGHIEDTAITISSRLAVGWLPLLTMGVAVAVIGGLQLFLARTQWGRGFRATSDNQRAAQLVGINNQRLYGFAMALALVTAGIAGVFIGIRTTFTPDAGSLRLIFAYEAVIMGGLGSLWGTLAGGILLGVAQTLGSRVDPGFGVLAGHLVFLAVLALRPQGLFAKQVDE